jgi:response regulator RpfG family c-di-GMP phosphodiesterase
MASVDAPPFLSTPSTLDAPVDKGSASILVVEDDPESLELMLEFLKAEGYPVEGCLTAEEAMDRLKEKAYSCLLSDHYLPKMDGLTLLTHCREMQPYCVRLLVTGAASLDIAIKAINSGVVYHFLTKPWSPANLSTAVWNGVRHHFLSVENKALHEQTVQLNQLLESANRMLRQNFDHSLELCRNLLETFSPLLGKTTRAVEEICDRFCELDLLDAEEQKILRVSATLHNIGLLGIPRDLLQKAFRAPHQLSGEQRRLIEKHPLYGETVVQFVGNLSGVAETIRAHHERWDGKGFPDGLREQAIPVPARYLAVATRFVESGLPTDRAMEQLQAESNQAFFPEAVRAFSRIFQSRELPRKVKEITFPELRPGMTLAKSLHSPSGLLLISEGKRVTQEMLNKIRNHSIMDHVNDPILVYL